MSDKPSGNSILEPCCEGLRCLSNACKVRRKQEQYTKIRQNHPTQSANSVFGVRKRIRRGFMCEKCLYTCEKEKSLNHIGRKPPRSECKHIQDAVFSVLCDRLSQYMNEDHEKTEHYVADIQLPSFFRRLGIDRYRLKLKFLQRYHRQSRPHPFLVRLRRIAFGLEAAFHLYTFRSADYKVPLLGTV